MVTRRSSAAAGNITCPTQPQVVSTGPTDDQLVVPTVPADAAAVPAVPVVLAAADVTIPAHLCVLTAVMCVRLTSGGSFAKLISK